MLTSRRAKHKLDLKALVRGDRWALSLGEQWSRTVCTRFSHTRHSGQGLAGREGHRLGCQPVKLLETPCTCTCGDPGLLREGEGRQWLVGGVPPSARGFSFILPVSFPVPPASLSSGHFESSNQGRPRRDRRTPLGRWVTTLNPLSTKDAHVHLALGPVDHRVCLWKTCGLGAGRPSEPHRPAWLERGRDRKE